MRRAWFLLCAAAAILLVVPVTAAPPPGPVGVTINATPASPRVGDTVVISGTVTGINTIAVYLFVTGPGLDPRGVALDNLNIPAGQGLFTTAPVNLQNGTWTYLWDTSVILGTLRPGEYTVHVVASPISRLRFSGEESASVPVEFRPPPVTGTETPLDPLSALAAIGVAGALLGVRVRRP